MTQYRLDHVQLRNLAKRIFNSPTIRADLENACLKSKIKSVQMVRDVATRWNSTAELLGRALQLREALNLLVILEHHNRPRSARLRRFQLTKSEWDLLEKLFPFLEVFYSLFTSVCRSYSFVYRFFSSRRGKFHKAKTLSCMKSYPYST